MTLTEAAKPLGELGGTQIGVLLRINIEMLDAVRASDGVRVEHHRDNRAVSSDHGVGLPHLGDALLVINRGAGLVDLGIELGVAVTGAVVATEKSEWNSGYRKLSMIG